MTKVFCFIFSSVHNLYSSYRITLRDTKLGHARNIIKLFRICSSILSKHLQQLNDKFGHLKNRSSRSLRNYYTLFNGLIQYYALYKKFSSFWADLSKYFNSSNLKITSIVRSKNRYISFNGIKETYFIQRF